jgi:hypothetical protein
MQGTDLNINFKVIKNILICCLLIACCVFILNQVDNRKKYQQFIELNSFLKNSKKVFEIQQLINDSLVNSKQQVDKVCSIMNSLKNDIRKFDDCELYIKKNERYYQINYRRNYENNVWANMKELEFLPSTEIENVVDLLDKNTDTPLEDIYGITKNRNYIWTIIKLKDAYFFAKLYKRD